MKQKKPGSETPGPAIPLLSTKLTPPLLKQNILPRENLVATFQKAGEHRLTLVCAGIGYGKTTFLAQALRRVDYPFVWYTLGRSDRDIVTFLAYLIEGIDRQWPGFAEAVSAPKLSGVNRQLELNQFVIHFINQMAELLTGAFLLVLDDFHLVETNPEIVQLVDYLLRYGPPQAHFVIASRAAPGLPSLTRLRATADLLEIGERELKLGAAETAVLLRQNLNLELADPLVEKLTALSEGWTLGLLVMGQACRGQSPQVTARMMADLESSRAAWQVGDGVLTPPENPGSKIAAHYDVLFDYFTEEILGHHPAHITDFLTGSAVLSWLEPAICNAILDCSDSEAILRYLEQNNLFVIRSEGAWLRYHHLFRHFLYQQLIQDRERFNSLSRRAAVYYAGQNNPDRAIYHYLEAGDYDQAAGLIEQAARERLQTGQVETLAFWIAQLPAALLPNYPHLLLRQGQIYERYGRWSQALSSYEAAAQIYSEQDDLVGLSETLTSKGHILDWWRGERVQAERLYQEALAYIGQENVPRRAALLRNLSRNHLSAGNTQAALALYQEALQTYESQGDGEGELTTLINPGSWLYHSTGNFSRALMTLRRAEFLAQELNNQRYLAEIYNNISVNLYFLWRGGEARTYAEQALALSRQIGDGHNEAYALMNLANAMEATCAAPAQTLYEQQKKVLRIEQAEGDQRFAIATLVFMTILLRRGDNLDEAVRRGKQALSLTIEQDLRWLTGFVLLNLGAAQIEVEAEDARLSIEGALEIARHCEDIYHQMASHFWLATLYHHESNELYIDQLRQCLELAAAHNLDYFFESEGRAAITLLGLALERAICPAFVAQVLIKFGSRSVKVVQSLLIHANDEVRLAAQAVLAEIGRRSGNGRYGQLPAVAPLAIYCFGNLRIRQGDRWLPEKMWGRRKAKRLLKYIILSPTHTIPRDEIVDRLWSDLDPDGANSNFYRTLYDVRRILEPQAPRSHSSYLALAGGLLRLVEEGVQSIDIDHFVINVESAQRALRRGDVAAARAGLETAVSLYTDDIFTDDLYDTWIEPQRERLRNLYQDSLTSLAALAAEAQEPEEAAGYLQKVMNVDCSREEICLKLIDQLLVMDRRAQALRCAEACARALADLGITPSPKLAAIQKKLLS
jgi:LuxR family transcriptional regulator, maltose regulon positive regulatory protein